MSADWTNRGGARRHALLPQVWIALLSMLGLVFAVTLPPLSTAGAASGSPGKAIGTLVATISDPGRNTVDNFGQTQAISGDTLAVSGILNGTTVVYIYTKGASGWPTSPAETLYDPGASNSDGFGELSLSLSGNNLVIGAGGGPDTGGDLYIYIRGPSGWPTTPTLTLKDPAATDGDDFGGSSVISGDTLAVGASLAGGSNSVIYIYTDGSTGWPTTPSVTLNNPEPGANFAISSVSGSTLVASAPSGATDNASGLAYIYAEGSSGWPTAPTVTLKDPVKNQGDAFVFASGVVVSGDTLVISASAFDVNTGVSYVYQKGASGWPKKPQITLQDPAAISGDHFGVSVAVKRSSLVVSAVGPNSGGVVYFYTKGASGWQTQPSATVPDPAPIPEQGDSFGYSVDLTHKGNLLAVTGQSDGAGLVYLYRG